MEPFWGEGAFTQLDVEPWKQYDRPVNADEIDEARDHHKRLLGRAAFVYINPNQMPKVFKRKWRDRNPKAALWLPNYSKNGAAKAEELGAEIHQHTDKYPSPGFKLGIDPNEVRDWACVRRMAGVSAN